MEERTNRQVAEEFFKKAEDVIRTEMGGNPTMLADLRTFRAGTLQTADEKLASHAFGKYLNFCRCNGHDDELLPYITVALRWCKATGAFSCLPYPYPGIDDPRRTPA